MILQIEIHAGSIKEAKRLLNDIIEAVVNHRSISGLKDDDQFKTPVMLKDEFGRWAASINLPE